MSRGARWSLLALAVLLAGAGMLRPDPRRELSPTTFGTAPVGYQAVFELFTELGLPVLRSYDPPGDLPADATVWWIEPDGVCRSERTSSEQDAGLEYWAGEEWIAEGGTAVVLLAPSNRVEEQCTSIAGIAVPKQTDVAAPSLHHTRAVAQAVTGPLVPQPRHIEAAELSTFTEAGSAEVLAQLSGQPFVLQHRLGQGRLVLVGDAHIVSNHWLDRADAAPLAMDLVRAFGVPRFDERTHGLHRERAPLRFLARSAALPALAGVLILALLFVWHGHALPPRGEARPTAGAPTLATFVDSLARLYAGTADYARVLVRYRELSVARLRRHFKLPPETPLPTVIDRLARSRRVAPERLALLEPGSAVASAAELRAAVAAIDAVVEEAMR